MTTYLAILCSNQLKVLSFVYTNYLKVSKECIIYFRCTFNWNNFYVDYFKLHKNWENSLLIYSSPCFNYCKHFGNLVLSMPAYFPEVLQSKSQTYHSVSLNTLLCISKGFRFFLVFANISTKRGTLYHFNREVLKTNQTLKERPLWKNDVEKPVLLNTASIFKLFHRGSFHGSCPELLNNYWSIKLQRKRYSLMPLEKMFFRKSCKVIILQLGHFHFLKQERIVNKFYNSNYVTFKF